MGKKVCESAKCEPADDTLEEAEGSEGLLSYLFLPGGLRDGIPLAPPLWRASGELAKMREEGRGRNGQPFICSFLCPPVISLVS